MPRGEHIKDKGKVRSRAYSEEQIWMLQSYSAGNLVKIRYEQPCVQVSMSTEGFNSA